MMLQNRRFGIQGLGRIINTGPSLNISKLGIVSRDYRVRFANGYRDFSYSMPGILSLLDRNGCDSVLFSLLTIVPRQSYSLVSCLESTAHINAVFCEEFLDGKKRAVKRFVVYYRVNNQWKEYEFSQVFGSLTGTKEIILRDFVRREMPKRILGNCCVLLCGESNGVKYSQKDKKVHDDFGLRKSIPEQTNIVLNPVHDRMTRFEMKLKRKFLSENGRWTVSVWNKGKEDINGQVKDGDQPAWTVYHNGVEIHIHPIRNNLGVEIGIIDFKEKR